jgi:hypothetical protein
MLRQTFLVFLCVTLAFIGASGLHDHVVLPDTAPPGTAHATRDVAPAHAQSEKHFFDAGIHDVADHEDHVDVDPVSKAFGKLSPGSLLALAFCLVLFTMVSRKAFHVRRRAPLPARAARIALFELLPPATAPPAIARAR